MKDRMTQTAQGTCWQASPDDTLAQTLFGSMYAFAA